MIRSTHKRRVIIMMAMLCTASYTKAQFVLTNEATLVKYKAQYKANNPEYVKVIKKLYEEADASLKAPLYSVTFHKTILPPSGDKHDYMSQAIYFWPDPSKPDGKPYIRKDGYINPETKLMKDETQMVGLCKNIRNLSEAYYFSGNEAYASKAIQLMQVWFLDKDTRMNPNLNYGQGIPGINNGRGFGLIDTRNMTNITEAFSFLKGSKSLTPELKTGIKAWFGAFTQWMYTSDYGKDENSQPNNHGTFYTVQLVDYALFAGDTALAKKTIADAFKRIAVQVEKDGSQPLEMLRTKSWSYSVSNLEGLSKLAMLAENFKLDLWHYETSDGRGLKHCFEWFLPFLKKEKTWNTSQVAPMEYDIILSLAAVAATKYPDLNFNGIFDKYPDVYYLPWSL